MALVLLLSLVPALSLTANAAHSGTWTYKSSYEWISGSFDATDSDQIYEDSQAYDWSVSITPTKSPPSSAQVVASIVDENGNTVSTYNNTVSGLAQRVETELCSYSDFPELTTSLYGSFTLTVELQLSGTTYATLVQTFSRVSSNPIVSTVTSRSNPDNAFTFADPIDLVLNIKKNDGVAVAYNAAVTVTKGSTEVLAARGVSLPASTNIVLSVKDLVNLPTITTAGTYSVNLTLTDSTGAVKHQASFPFYVMALSGNLTATITSASGSSLTFNSVVPDMVVNLTKTDNLPETLITAVTVKNSSGTAVYSNTFTTTGATATVTPDLSGLATTGTFTMSAVVTDDAGNQRASASVTFTRTNTTPMTCTVSDYNTDNTGNIYSASDDYSVNLAITHTANKGKVVSVKVSGTLNGKEYESNTKKTTLSSLTGKATVKIDGTMLGAYGIFEDLYIVVSDSSGNELWRSTDAQQFTSSFARVLDTSTPGDLPILNINDHFTSGKGDAALKIPLAAQTGANMWRSTIPWATVEKTQGVYDITVVKSVMDATKNNGMQALVILAYGNEDVYGENNPSSTTWVNAYANYCGYVAEQMAKYYPDQVVGFEIWNEFNHASMGKIPEAYRTPANYVEMVKAASAKIRQVNSKYGTNFKVIGCASAGDGYTSGNSQDFIKGIMAISGFFDAIDGISFHTYSSVETTSWSDQLKGQRTFEYISPAEHDFAARIEKFNGYLKQYNAPSDLEVWITETGWTTNEVPESGIGSTDGKTHITYGATEEDAAAYLVQLYTWALANGTVDRIFWYDLMNDISNQTKIWANNQTESNYGLIHNWNNSGDQPLAYSAKAGYVTMCALGSKLGNVSYHSTLSLGDGVYAYQFTKSGGGYIAVVWTDGTAKTLNATLSKSITVSDMYGNATTYSAGSAALALSEAPIYIEYTSGAISSIG